MVSAFRRETQSATLGQGRVYRVRVPQNARRARTLKNVQQNLKVRRLCVGCSAPPYINVNVELHRNRKSRVGVLLSPAPCHHILVNITRPRIETLPRYRGTLICLQLTIGHNPRSPLLADAERRSSYVH